MSHPLIEASDPEQASAPHASAPLQVRKASAFMKSPQVAQMRRWVWGGVGVCLGAQAIGLGMLVYNLSVVAGRTADFGVALPIGICALGYAGAAIGLFARGSAAVANIQARNLVAEWERAQALAPAPVVAPQPADALIEQIVARAVDPSVASAARQAGARANTLRTERAALAAMIAGRPETASTLNASLARIDADLAEIDAQLAALYAGLAALDTGNPPALEDAGHRVAADLEVARKLESARRAEKLQR